MSKVMRSERPGAVVTGAGSGIGRALALTLSQRGYRVVCADIDLQAAERTAAVAEAALPVQCDVSRLDDVESLAEKSEHWLGETPAVVVNNAGVGAGGLPIGAASIEDWRWVLGVNLWGVIHGCHVFVPRLRARGSGGVLNVCSAASFAAAPMMGAYNTSKAGALAVTETLAAELAGSGIRVTALCPTFVKTGIFENGRIHGRSVETAQRLAEKTGWTPERIAVLALDSLERGRLHVLPQWDARAVWRGKRLAPALYTRGAALVGRWLAPPATHP